MGPESREIIGGTAPASDDADSLGFLGSCLAGASEVGSRGGAGQAVRTQAASRHKKDKEIAFFMVYFSANNAERAIN